MAKVPNAEEKLTKISTGWVGRTNVTDRQTTDGTAIAYSERERKFTFAKKSHDSDHVSLVQCLRSLDLPFVNLCTKFEVPSFTDSKHVMATKKLGFCGRQGHLRSLQIIDFIDHTWLVFLHYFWDMARSWSKIDNFTYPICILCLVGDDIFGISPRSLEPKTLQQLSYHAALIT